MKTKIFVVLLGVFALAFVNINAQNIKSEYKIARTINLTGDSGWDYLSVDMENSRLFVSHGNQVNVVDLRNGKEIAVIPYTKGVHGIAIANDLNKAFISCGRDTSVAVVDLNKFSLITRVKVTGQNPDAILYDKFSHQVFTCNGRSSNLTVIDATTNKVVNTISLPGKPEFSQTNGIGTIFVNIEDKSQIVSINTTTLKVEKTWSIAPGEGPSGLAFDRVNNRLFSVCDNKLLIVSDAMEGKVVASVHIGEECDGVSFDPQIKRIFTSNGEGTMTIVQQESADKYFVVENFITKQGARTITVDNVAHKIYLPVAERVEGSRTSKPGTFSVLEIELVK